MLKKTLVLLDAGQVVPDRPLVERRGADTWRRAAVGGVCLGVLSLSERSKRSCGLSYIYKKERQLAAQYRAGAVYICVVYTYMCGVFYI